MTKNKISVAIGIVIFLGLLVSTSYASLNVKAIANKVEGTENLQTSITENTPKSSKVSNNGDTLTNVKVVNKTSYKMTSNKTSINDKKNIIQTATLKTDRTLTLEHKNFELTFYTGLAEENGGYAYKNAYGGKLAYGQVASNVYPKGTIIKLEGIGTFTVMDTGGSDFDSYNRLDVYIPPKSGENPDVYKKRVNDLGRKNVKGYIVN